MKFLPFLLLLCPGILSAHDVFNPYGFRYVNFETKASDIPYLMDKVAEVDQTIYYRSVSEDVKIEDATVSSITYGFYKGKFSSVEVTALGSVNSDLIFKTLQSTGIQLNKISFIVIICTTYYERNRDKA